MTLPAPPASFDQLRLHLLALASGLALTGCSGLGKPNAVEEVQPVVQGRTGVEVVLPRSQMEQRDVDARVSLLLGKPLTARMAAQVALLKSRRVRATLEELNLSQADLLEASLPANPSLASSVRWPHSGSGTNAEFELAGDVLNWLLLPLRKKLALREYEAAKRRVSHDLLDVVFETKEAFYEAQAQEQILKKLELAGEVNHVSAEIAQRLRAAGNITELELLQEQATADQAGLELRKTRGELAVAREKLSRVLELSTTESRRFRLTESFPAMPASEPAPARLEALAISQRQDLAAQGEVVAALAQGHSLTRKMRYFPGLNLGVNTEGEPDGGRLTGPTLELELPVFDQGQGRLRRSSAQLAQAQATYEALNAEVRSDVRTALAQLQSAREVHRHLKATLLPQRQRILAETLLQYNAMQVSTFILLRAKEDEVNAQRDAVEALRDYWVARAELEKAVGGSLSWRPAASSEKAVSKIPAGHHDHY